MISLVAALAAVGALGMLTDDRDRRPTTNDRFSTPSFIIRLSPAGRSGFLALPIVREWSWICWVCMGLWGLCSFSAIVDGRCWAALPLALSLLVTIAKSRGAGGALLWLLFRDWRQALLLGGLIALLGRLAVGALELGGGGWFLLHTAAANANAWDSRPMGFGDRCSSYGRWWSPPR
jgi:hypothetical protein